MAKKSKSKKPVTQELPLKGRGVELAKIKEIETAAEAYVEARDERMELTKTEVAAKKELMDVMKKHKAELIEDGSGAISYRYDEKLVTLKPVKETVQVKSIHEEPDTDIEDD